MAAPEQILLDPKGAFTAVPKAAAAHCDVMASPAFKQAAATAMLQYQWKLGGDPQVFAISMAKLRGAQEYLRELMNLGIPDTPGRSIPDIGLVPPEESLNRPYQPPKKQ